MGALLDHLQACQPAAPEEDSSIVAKARKFIDQTQAEAKQLIQSARGEEGERQVDLHKVSMTGLEAAFLVKGHLSTLALGDIYIEDFSEKHGVGSVASTINVILQTLLRSVCRN